MSGTNVPEPTFGDAGIIVPAESAVLAGLQADIDAAFGGDLNPALEMPQGQLASSQSAIVGNKNDQLLFLANQFDPARNSGRWQDGVGRIYFQERFPPTGTVVQTVCSGLTSTPIPTGIATAIDQADPANLYLCTSGGTIGPDGTLMATFTCTTTGPIACPPNSLRPYRTIPGWDSMTNDPGIPGSLEESRSAYELRRQQSAASNASGTTDAILGSVLAVSGVLDAFVYDNATAAPVTLGGVTIAANSLYAAVLGGLATDVAFAIWRKKGPGAPYTGSTSVTVVDPNPFYAGAGPSYVVKFQIPSVLTVGFAVTIANGPLVPSDALAQITAAIAAALSGADGQPRARIGQPVYTSRFYAGIAALGPWARIVSIFAGSLATPVITVTGSISGTVLTVTVAGSNLLAAGQVIRGTGIPEGTWILNQLGGTAGGVGTYTISQPLAVTSEAIAAYALLLNAVPVRIDQTPGLGPVTLTLV